MLIGKRVIVMDKVRTSSLTNTLRTCGRRIIASGMLLAALTSMGGCRICASCEENAYAAYGGAWQRTTRENGRVGSLFDPAGGLASDLVSRDDPEKPADLERARQEALGTGESDDDSGDEQMQDDAEDSEDRNLLDRELDDINEPKELELREKELEDINIHVIPGQPVPPLLR